MGLWLDELFSLTEFLRGSWSELFTFYSSPNNHILYSILAKICINLFGEKEWSLRLPSVIMGTFTPPVFFLLFRKIFGAQKALLASLMMIPSFWMVWFSQDARGYAGMILFSGLSQFLYLDFLQNPRKRTGFYYVLCSALSSWFHLYALFIIAGQAFYGFFSFILNRQTHKPLIFILPALALTLGLTIYAMVFDQLFAYALKGGKEIQDRWLGLYFWKDLIKMLSGTQFLMFALACLILFIIGLFRSVKLCPGLVILYLLPAGLIILTTFILKIFIFSRFLAFLIPFFFINISAGIEFIELQARKLFPIMKQKIIYISVAVMVFIFLFSGLVRYYHLGKQGFKDVSIYIKRRYPFRDVVSLGSAAYGYLYYDRYAQPLTGVEPIAPEELEGKLVVASHFWSISPENIHLLARVCEQELYLSSAGAEDYGVVLYRCFK